MSDQTDRTQIRSIEVSITVTARLPVTEVVDLYEQIGEVATYYCGDDFTMRQHEEPSGSPALEER